MEPEAIQVDYSESLIQIYYAKLDQNQLNASAEM